MIGHHRHREIITTGLTLLASHHASAQVDPASHQSFADELTSALYTNANECTSALGVSMAFSLVYPGCTNDGITEIRDTMGYPDGDDGDEDDTNMQLVWAGTTQRMLSDSAGQCLDSWCSSDAPLLKIANSVWFDDGSALSNSYEDVVGSYAKQIDFEAADSPVLVNKWVSNSTNGLIKSIVPEDKPLFPPYVLIAINSIYLKARWSTQFKDYRTNLDSFYASSSRNVDEASDAHFMNTVGYYSYSHDALPGYQVIDLPFAASDMSMIFVIPTLTTYVNDDPEAVSSTDLIGALDDMESTRVALSLPKFKFESTYSDNLKAALISAGITAPFTEGSKALCGIFEDSEICDQLIIDKVVQKTIIDVNEDGVEAAAVTGVMAGITSVGPEDTNEVVLMMLDHPFQFFIYDKSEELMLFEGRLGAPEIEGKAEMDGKHSDPGFWSSKFNVEPVTIVLMEPPPVIVEVTSQTSTTVENLSTEQSLDPTEQSSDPTSPSNSVSQPDKAPIVATTIDTTEHQKFADELTTILYTNDNECSSALGVSMAFSLVYPGCTDDGITEIRDVMRYPDGSNMQLVWEGTTQRMLDASSGVCVQSWGDECEAYAPLLQIANSVWLDDNSTLNAGYAEVVDNYAKQIDFKADDSPIIVNDWVSNSTNGLIDSIVPEDKPLFPPFVLLAINSIYLKARWAEQFEERNTNLDTFYASASRNAQVSDAHFMNMVNYFPYSHEAMPGYQVIDLPFAESQMSMIFVLPMSDDAGAVQSSDLLPALGGLQSTRVALSVPKFKFESEYKDNLKSALIQLGIVAPFTEGSGALCGVFEDIDNCEKLIISEVIQKTVIDVNEEGVEAAAVTMIGMSLTSMPPPDAPVLMMLDHPFQFFIYDKTEDLVLFEGRVGAPEVPEAEPAVPLLDSVHSDAEFWSSAFNVPDPVAPSVDKTITVITKDPVTSQATPTSSPTKAVPSSPTNAPNKASESADTPQPSAASDSSTYKRCFSLLAFICLAPALVFAL